MVKSFYQKKIMHGIICIETEWQVTKKKNRLTLNSEPLLRYVSEMYQIPYFYRRVATKSELSYYLKQFSKKEYEAKKSVYSTKEAQNSYILSTCFEQNYIVR